MLSVKASDYKVSNSVINQQRYFGNITDISSIIAFNKIDKKKMLDIFIKSDKNNLTFHTILEDAFMVLKKYNSFYNWLEDGM